MHHPCPPLQTPSPCPLGSSHTGLVVPPWISHIWFYVKAFKHTVPSAWNALPLRSLHGCLYLKSQFSAGYSVYTFASKQAAQLFLGITASSSPGVIKNLLWLYHLQITQGINQMRMLWSIQPGVCTQSYILMVFFFFFTGYFQSFVTTIWYGEPLQCQSSGAAEDHQPSCAAAKTTVLSLSEKWPECKASTFYTLRNLWFHRQGQLLL